MEKETIELDFKIDFKEYRKLLFKLSYQNPLMVFLTLIGILNLCAFIAYVMDLDINPGLSPWANLGMGLFFTFYLPIAVLISVNKAYKTNAYLNEPLNVSFDENLIKVRGESFYSEYEWKNVVKIIKLKNWVVIHTSKTVGHPIPISAFRSESDLLKFKEFSRLHDRSVQSSSSLFINKITGAIKFFISFMITSGIFFAVITPDRQLETDPVFKIFTTILTIVLALPYLFYLVRTGYTDFKNNPFKKGILIIIGLVIHFIIIFAAIFTGFQADMQDMLPTLLIMLSVALFIGIRDIIRLREAYISEKY